MLSKKRGQGWGFDLIVACILFISGVLVFYVYSINISDDSNEMISRLSTEGNAIADSLLSEGYPADWDNQSVIILGIVSEEKINQTKLEMFYHLSNNEYNRTKELLKTRYNYFINSSVQFEIDGEKINGIGLMPMNHSNLIKVSKLSVYKNKISTITIQVWG